MAHSQSLAERDGFFAVAWMAAVGGKVLVGVRLACQTTKERKASTA